MALGKTIREQEKEFRKSSVVMYLGIVLISAYLLLTIDAYLSVHPRAGFLDAAAELGNILSETPLYFIPIINGVFVPYDCSLTVGIIFIEVAIFFLMYTLEKLRLHHDINILKGSAHWANMSEAIKKFADFEGKDYKHVYQNVPFSQNLYMTLNTRKHGSMLNTLIIGKTGAGKSRYFLKPNLLQMNTCYVITDPKGAILQENGEALRRQGYNVHILDLVTMGNCDAYNPLEYCKRESDIKKAVQAFIVNTDPTGGKGGGQKDPFWDDAMNAFLCSMIAFLTQCPKGSDIPYGQIPDVTGGGIYAPCFPTLCELTRMANSPWSKDCGIALMPGAKLGDGKNNTANASKLAAIFENLRQYEAKLQNCDVDMIEKPYCLREWENFKIAPEKTSTTILMTVAVRLDPFNVEQVRKLMSTDTMQLDKFATHRDILFIIIPTDDKSPYNFIASFLYTQLFDQLYLRGETKTEGSINLKLPNGELVQHYDKEEVDNAAIDAKIEALHNCSYTKVEKLGMQTGVYTERHGRKVKKTKVSFFDGWYDIFDANGEYVSRRATKQLAEQYIHDLKHVKKEPGRGIALPCHVRFLMDEFANIGEVPGFKGRLATVRQYEISVTVIVQSITQLKGIYPDDYEVIDANCPQTVFLGGDENSNNEYMSKKLGMQTVKGANNSVDSKKVNASYNVEQRELMRPEELGQMPPSDEIVIVSGYSPIYDKKFDYPGHKNYRLTKDFCDDIGAHGAGVFERESITFPNVVLIDKYEKPVSIPDVKPFEVSVFKRLMCASDMNTAVDRSKRAAQRFSLESGSEAIAF